MTFSRARLKGHRHGKGLSPQAVADLVMICGATYAEIERGEDEPPTALVSDLARALQVPVSELESPEGTPYFTDYADAFLAYAPPLGEADLNRAARALHRTTT